MLLNVSPLEAVRVGACLRLLLYGSVKVSVRTLTSLSIHGPLMQNTGRILHRDSNLCDISGRVFGLPVVKLPFAANI